MYDEYFAQIEEECRIRNLSSRTCQLYKSNVSSLLKQTNKSPENLTLQDAREYILSCRNRGLSAAHCNTCNASFAFFFRHVLHKTWDPEMVPRMKVDYTFPAVLSLEEIERLIDTAKSPKYKALIAVMYSAGLRVSEACRLRYEDVSRSTMQIHVTQTKNRMDHYTILSHKALDLLTEYWFAAEKPRGYLFPCKNNSEQPISISSVELALRKISKAAGINRKIHPHLLRHSFATHLIEAGVQPIYVQTLLGHRSIDSTNKYIHLANKSVMGIRSPLDHSAAGFTSEKPGGTVHV